MKKFLITALLSVFAIPFVAYAYIPLPPNQGGTGSGVTPTTGEILYATGGNYTQLPIGNSGQVLGVQSGIPAWVTGGSGSSGSGTFSTTSPYGTTLVQYPYTTLFTSLDSSATSSSGWYYNPLNKTFYATYGSTTALTAGNLYDGILTNGYCVQAGANGQLTSASAACGSGSGFSTTSANYWLTLNQGNAFSTTSANYWGGQQGYITSAVTAVTGSYPIVSSGGNTPNITFSGLATTSTWTNGQLAMVTSNNQVTSVPTTTVSCAGSASCTTFTIPGSSPITITASGGSLGSGNFLYLNPQNAYYAATTTAQWLVDENSTTTKAALEVNGGIFASASSTIPLLTTQQATSTNATTTNEDVSKNLTIAALSGVLKATSGLVSAASNGTDYTLLTSANCAAGTAVTALTASGGSTCANDFSTTSAAFWQTQNNFFSTTSANYWCTQTSTCYFAYPFTGGTLGTTIQNSTSTLLNDTGGFYSSASSTLVLFSATNATTTFATSTDISATNSSTTNLIISGLGESGTQCLQVGNTGSVSGTGSACGSGGGGGTNTNMFATSTTPQNAIYDNTSQYLGIGSSSPWAYLAVSSSSPTANVTTPFFAIASTTGGASQTIFSVASTGTTTSSNGFNITQGCYAVAGVCIIGGQGATVSFASTTASTLTANTTAGATLVAWISGYISSNACPLYMTWNGVPVGVNNSGNVSGTPNIPFSIISQGVPTTTTTIIGFNGNGCSPGDIAIMDEIITPTQGINFSYPFTPMTNYAATNQATTGIIWEENGINASSTSNFVYASTTAISASGLTNGDCVQATTGGLLTSASGACGSGSGSSFSTTSANYWSSQGLGFSTTSANYNLLNFGWSTTTSTTNGLTSALTISTSTGGFVFTPSQSGTLTVAGGGTGQSSLTQNQVLYGVGTGAVQSEATGTISCINGAATCGAGSYVLGSNLILNAQNLFSTTSAAYWCNQNPDTCSLGYTFPLTGNATSTLTQFNGGLTGYASSTIGNGSVTGGLTVSGTASTTNLIVTSPTATSTIAGGLTVSGVLTAGIDRSMVLASSTLAYMGGYGSAGTTTLIVMNPSKSATLISLYCITDTGTGYVVMGNGSATTTALQCTNSGAELDPSSNNTWTQRQDIFVGIGDIANSPNRFTITTSIK